MRRSDAVTGDDARFLARGRRLLLVILPVMLVGTACGSASETPGATSGASGATTTRAAPADATGVPASVDAGHGTVVVTMPVQFPEARTLVRGDLLLQGRSRRASLSPRDGRDLDGPGLIGPIQLRAGVRTDVRSGWIAYCADPAGVPVLTVTSRKAGGRVSRDRYVPADLAAYDKAFAGVCRAGVQGAVVGSRQDPDGTFSVDLTLVNPGPDEVTVTSAAYKQGGARWNAASVVVPVGRSAQLRITGEGEGCAAATPWATGHLEANGKPLKLSIGTNEQC